MNQLQKLLNTLSLNQKIGMTAAVLLVVAGVSGFVKWRRESDFRPLFTGMAAEDAAAVVQKVKESGSEYRLEENGSSVLVPSARVDELRLAMAAAGLPKTGRVGFELFDKTNIGITDFTEHVNYRRALEGELERSVRSLSAVDQARVHISFPKDSVFLDAKESAKASVLVSLRPGARLSDSNVLAITNLIASAVEGLTPDFVSVVDMRGNLLSRPKRASLDSPESSDGALEYKHQVEKDLMAKVEATLAPLLGVDHFRIGISADCDFTTSEQTDESYDPTRSVMTTSQKSEDLAGAPQSAGVPGTPSNLPRSTVRPTSASSGVSRRTENVAYETSRTVRQVKTPRGSLKRISASLLIDQESRWEGKGAHTKRIMVPPTPERLKTIHDIVAGVLGITPDRGDQLIVESLPFEQNREDDSLPTPASTTDHRTELQKMISNPRVFLPVGGAVLLLVAFLAFRLLKKKPAPKTAQMRASIAAREEAEVKPPVVQEKQVAPEKPQVAVAGLQTPQLSAVTERVAGLRQHLRESVNRDPILAANVIRGWIAEDES